MDPVPWRLVTFDIDGTLTLRHGWRVLAERFDRVPLYERTMDDRTVRRVGEDATLTGLLRIAEGHTVAEVQEALRVTPRLRRIPEGVADLRQRKIHAALLTHNPSYVTDWYCETMGFEAAAGMGGAQATEPTLGPPERIRAQKSIGLRDLVERFGVSAQDVVHVGDSTPDAEIFPLVGGGVSVNSRFPAVDRAADAVVRTDQFPDVVRAVLGLSRRK